MLICVRGPPPQVLGLIDPKYYDVGAYRTPRNLEDARNHYRQAILLLHPDKAAGLDGCEEASKALNLAMKMAEAHYSSTRCVHALAQRLFLRVLSMIHP